MSSTTAARIVNLIVPWSVTPFGAMYSSDALNGLPCSAPTFSTSSMPCLSLPTSDSSTSPSKIMSFMSASVASDVPDWKVLDSMMNEPSLFGRSRIVPSMVAGIMLDTMPELLVAPVRNSNSEFSDEFTASFCTSYVVTYWLNCDCEITPSAASFR